MAAGVSGSFTVSGNKAGITCRVQYSETYDIEANTSSVKVRVQFKAGSGGWYGYTYYLTGAVSAAGSRLVTCSSTTGYDKVRWNALNTYAYMQAGSGAATSWTKSGIAHDADGSKSISIAVNLTGYTTDGGHGNGWNVNGSKTISLTTIPRASDIGATDASIGAVSMVAVTRKSTAYTHSIAYAFGPLSGYLTPEGGVSAAEVKYANTSVAFAVPASFYAQIPNAKSGVCTLTCRTYSGDTQIGAATGCAFTVTAAEGQCAPVVSGAAEDANPVTLALTGDKNRLVRYFSAAQCTIAATARNGASILTRIIAGTAVAGSERTIANTETGTFLFSATDSRGYTASAAVTKPLVDYVRLTCDGAVSRAGPTASTAVLSLSGNYFNASFGAADNALSVFYQLDGGGAVPLTPALNGNGWSVSAALNGVDYTRSYTVTITAADRLMTVTKTLTLNRGVPVFDWGQSSFRVNVPLSLTGGLDAATKRALLDLIYPVGSYYWSSNGTDPGALFGGSWTQITGRFLLAAGGGYGVNTTGGAESHAHGPGSYYGRFVITSAGQVMYNYINTEWWSTNWELATSGQKSRASSNGSTTGMSIGGASAAAGNMPPYIAAYCWRRIA